MKLLLIIQLITSISFANQRVIAYFHGLSSSCEKSQEIINNLIKGSNIEIVCIDYGSTITDVLQLNANKLATKLTTTIYLIRNLTFYLTHKVVLLEDI